MPLLGPTEARAAWSVTAGGKNSARSGDPAGMPPDRQAVVAPPQARHADDVAPEIVGALEAQGLHPAEQISLCWPHRRRAESDAGQCDQVTAAVRVPRGRDRHGAGAAPPTADAAKRRSAAATMRPQNSSLCAGCAIYSFSPHTATKVIMPARGDGKETKRS